MNRGSEDGRYKLVNYIRPYSGSMVKIILFFALLCEFSDTFSQDIKDTIFFNNGSRIIGEIKRIKLGVVTFDPDDANDLTVQLFRLKTISARSTVFRIETTDHKVYFGQLIPDTTKLYVRVAQINDTSELYIQDITVLYPFKKSFAQRFSGSLGLGVSYTRSSDFGQFNFNGKLSYVSKKEELIFSTSGIYTKTDTIFSRDREDINLKNNFYFSPTWFASILAGYQKNLELGLERRFQEGLGIGNKYLTSKHVYAWARSGLVLNHEKSTENVSSGTLAELYGQIEFNFFRFTKPEINFLLAESFFISLSERGRFRNDGEAVLSWEIIDDLKFDLTFYSSYDSKPPTSESTQFDFGIVFGLNYTF